MLEKFPVTRFISGMCGNKIEQLWHEFYQLYNVLQQSQLSDQEICQYKVDAKNWVRNFCCPSQ
ncbi:19837_t:CDS:1, partial [Racocetra persica]